MNADSTMLRSTPADTRIASIARIAETQNDVASLRRHLNDVVRGAAFQGSHRSGQFLEYIVEKSLAGQYEALKERVIGIELFGRSPVYNTSEDSIVRVTASDVRRRLLQHYGRFGASSEFRISLPIGTYIPEITRERDDKADLSEGTEARQEPAILPHDSEGEHQGYHPPSNEQVVVQPLALGPALKTAISEKRNWRPWLTLVILLATLNLALWGIFWSRSSRANYVPASVIPWSAFFSSPRTLHLITSDPSIFEIQRFTGQQISVADYANHNYIPESNSLTPDIKLLCQEILRGDKSASAIDPPIAAEIAALAQNGSKHIDVRAARNIQFSDLKNDDNFIFLGSPSSDPWSAYFSEQLDFRFEFDSRSGQEVIHNVHSRSHEVQLYAPTAPGWSTGQSFAIIALVRNPDQRGQVLLIAGESAEGTEAAGKLVTDIPQLTAILQKCGISASSARQGFELLLKLNAMAGSPDHVDVTACHILSGTASETQ